MILRARIVLPMSRPPIEDGAVCISGSRIAWVGPWSDLAPHKREDVLDLGEMILLPGLVNAHCHLDYTDMAGKIAPPKSFADWVKSVVALKGACSYVEFAQSWLHGAEMLLRTGTTTVADVEAVPDLIPDMWATTPIRVISFRELVCLRFGSTAAQAIRTTSDEWSALPDAHDRAGLSPHAPYTTSAESLQLAAELARKRNWRLTTHVAESEEEFEMFTYRHGALYDWLKSQRDMSDCGLGSPVQHLERCGYLDENLLAVHVNYLWRHDAGLLGKRKVSVAHCPRSHAYFRHLLFPHAELAAAAVNLCLGTDSLASVRTARSTSVELSMFAEMRALAASAPDVSPATILRMATLNGALALGRKGEIGELCQNALADLIAIPFAANAAQAYEAVVHHSEAVAASMIDGQWAIKPSGASQNYGRAFWRLAGRSKVARYRPDGLKIF
jgi:cytosine/adenosine deaminase-related metal-dependent hydrolase